MTSPDNSQNTQEQIKEIQEYYRKHPHILVPVSELEK